MTSLPPITRISAAFPAVRMSSIVLIAVGESRISVLTYSTPLSKKTVLILMDKNMSVNVWLLPSYQYGFLFFLRRFPRPCFLSPNDYTASSLVVLTKGGAQIMTKHYHEILSWLYIPCRFLIVNTFYDIFSYKAKEIPVPIFFPTPISLSGS